MNEFQCVFCGEKINEEEKVSSILLTTHWLNETEQEDQQLFCHLECFKSKCFDENKYLTVALQLYKNGSPIIQDGKIIGAVTHVFVNDPTRGYGIFIENMLSESTQ